MRKRGTHNYKKDYSVNIIRYRDPFGKIQIRTASRPHGLIMRDGNRA